MSKRLTKSQQDVLGAAARAGLHGDGVRVRGALVATARSLDKLGFVRCSDFSAYGAGAQVRITTAGIREVEGITAYPLPEDP